MNVFKKISYTAVAFVVATPAFAEGGVDLSPLTSSIDATSIITALLAIGGVLGAVAVAALGIRKVVGFIK